MSSKQLGVKIEKAEHNTNKMAIKLLEGEKKNLVELGATSILCLWVEATNEAIKIINAKLNDAFKQIGTPRG